MLRQLKGNVVHIIGKAIAEERPPFGDVGAEYWGCNNLWCLYPSERFDRWFDLHTPICPGTLAWIKNEKQAQRGFYSTFAGANANPGVMEYPRAWIAQQIGAPYFTSTIAYELALAWALQAGEVHVHGVALSLPGEIMSQRCCLEYWIGVLRGSGARVTVHGDTALFQCAGVYPDIYGVFSNAS